MATNDEVAQVFSEMVNRFRPDKAQGIDTMIQFDLAGDSGGKYWVKIADGQCTTGAGEVNDAKLTVRASGDDWFNIATGKLNVMQAFMAGKLKVQGDMMLGMKLQPMFGL
jgi:putative sterol carrier protein